MKNQVIDFVITWVDGSDPIWFQEKQKIFKKAVGAVDTDDRSERYRDWGILKYLFRSIEKFAPWVNNVYFVTCGHLPEWLNTECSKLQIVSHKDFIPQKYLPTFNSHPIEWNFHRIKNLSEHFVYFNDDIFLLQPIEPTDFFRDGKPVDMLALQPDVANVEDTVMPYIYLNNTMLLAKYYRFFWEKEEELLDGVCSHPFRHKDDVSQYVLREYQKLSGDFVPRNTHKLCKYFNLKPENPELVKAIAKQTAKCICINDSNFEIPYEHVKRELNDAFSKLFPQKSQFEK